MKFQTAAVHGALGALGGAIAYGIHWGINQIPVENVWAKTAIFAGAGGAASIGLSMWADDRVGGGTAGGVGYALTHRIGELIQIQMAKNDAGAVYMREGGAVYRMNPRTGRRTLVGDAGAPRAREAGALVGGATRYSKVGGTQTMRDPAFGTSFKGESGASRYVPGPVRWFGPQSWAYRYGEAGARRYVSAHNR